MGTKVTKKPYAKPYEELTFSDDFMFCKILQTHPDLCKELVEMIIGRRIRKIVSQDTQKSIQITANAKGVRFDVYLEDDAFSVYDIEMQTEMKQNLPKRLRYYQGMIDLNILERGVNYKKLKKTYIIFICLENLFPNIGLHKYTFLTTCQEKTDLVLADETVKILLAATGKAEDVSEEMKAFLSFLITQEADSDFTRQLKTEVEIARKHKKWRSEYMTLQEKFDEIREEAQEEKINAFLSFVKRGKLSLEDGAEGAGISEEEFRQRLEEQS